MIGKMIEQDENDRPGGGDSGEGKYDREASNLELQISHSSRSSPFMRFWHFWQVFLLGSGNEIDLHRNKFLRFLVIVESASLID